MKANRIKAPLIVILLHVDANALCHILVASHKPEEPTLPEICTLLGWRPIGCPATS